MSKSLNLLLVQGVIPDRGQLWQVLRAFEAVGAKDVSVRPVVLPETQLLLPAPEKPAKKGPHAAAIIKLLTEEPVTNVVHLAEKTGLTKKQIHMALYHLMKNKRVKKTATGFYYRLGEAA